MKKPNRKIKFFIIYASILIVALALIMFIIPDSFFLRKYKNIELPTQESPTKTTPKEFVDYEVQKERLLKNNYSYEYSILDNKMNIYKCQGTINNDLESGICTNPQKFTYTEKDKKQKFNNIDYKLLDISYIMNLIKDITPEERNFSTTREYLYQIQYNNLKTDITIFTDLENINKIEFDNAEVNYFINFSNITY